MAPRSLASIVLFLLTLSGCVTNEVLQVVRADLSRLETRVTTLTRQVETTSAAGDQTHARATATTEQLTQAQHGQADLSVRLEAQAVELRRLKGQGDTLDRQVERIQAQMKETGDRLSRAEFNAAQAAMMAQQASSTAQLTATSAQTALQSMAEQINQALAELPATPRRGATPQEELQRSPKLPSAATSPTSPAPAHFLPPTAAPRSDRLEPNAPTQNGSPPGAGSLRTFTPHATDAHALPGPPETATVPTDTKTGYRLALTAFTQERYAEATKGFEALLHTYPSSPLTPLVLYWLGEAYYAQHAYDLATDIFLRFLSAQPSGQRAPSALLKLALIAQAKGQLTEARQRLTTLTRDYGASQEAAIAHGLLAGMR